MAKYTVYAYADGRDLHEVADHLSTRFNDFINGREWVSARVILVNQIRNESGADPEGDLPDWELGLNFDLPERAQRDQRWFEDVEATANFLGELREESGRDFVIGLGDNETGFGEDYLFIDSGDWSAEGLRQMLE